jgi:plasmid stability protein
MADVTIHEIDPELLERLEARARAFGRSLEEEILAIIRRDVPKHRSRESLRRAAHASHERLRGRVFSDSTDLIREDRDR